jgi:hypothetical protein
MYLPLCLFALFASDFARRADMPKGMAFPFDQPAAVGGGFGEGVPLVEYFVP